MTVSDPFIMGTNKKSRIYRMAIWSMPLLRLFLCRFITFQCRFVTELLNEWGQSIKIDAKNLVGYISFYLLELPL